MGDGSVACNHQIDAHHRGRRIEKSVRSRIEVGAESLHRYWILKLFRPVIFLQTDQPHARDRGQWCECP